MLPQRDYIQKEARKAGFSGFDSVFSESAQGSFVCFSKCSTVLSNVCIINIHNPLALQFKAIWFEL